jgi:hypothetical protein
MRWALTAVVIIIMSAPAATSAHHSISAMYDRAKELEIDGQVSRVDVRNPHSIIIVEAAGPRGTRETWELESRGAGGMQQSGFSNVTLQVGERVRVKGSPAHDGSKRLWLVSLTAGEKTFDFSRRIAP